MLFHSLAFLVFLPVVLGGHALLRGAAARWWLVAASYLFYGWGDPYWCLLLAFSTVLDYTVALRIAATDNPAARRRWLALSLAGNLGLLGVFKYSHMLGRWVVWAADVLFGVSLVDPATTGELQANPYDLPVGISFYTFQTLSYTIDVYQRRLEPERRFSCLALYVAFFPQLVAGPIERAAHLLPQLAAKQARTATDVVEGATRVLWGMVKKVVFADWFGYFVARAWENPGQSSELELFVALHAFSFQVYLDFSAYSDMAIGLARMMGIRLRENFQWPFLSRNPVEFWTRWHISLSTWVRDYVYIPLGGAKVGPIRRHANSLATMLAIGLWHGADEKFLVWGFSMWVYEIGWRAWVSVFGTNWYRGKPFDWGDTVPILLTYGVWLPHVFFGAPSLNHAFRILEKLFTGSWATANAAFSGSELALVTTLLGIAMVTHVVRGLGLDRRVYHLRTNPFALGALWAVMLVCILLLQAPTPDAFYYFQF